MSDGLELARAIIAVLHIHMGSRSSITSLSSTWRIVGSSPHPSASTLIVPSRAASPSSIMTNHHRPSSDLASLSHRNGYGSSPSAMGCPLASSKCPHHPLSPCIFASSTALVSKFSRTVSCISFLHFREFSHHTATFPPSYLFHLPL